MNNFQDSKKFVEQIYPSCFIKNENVRCNDKFLKAWIIYDGLGNIMTYSFFSEKIAWDMVKHKIESSFLKKMEE